MNKPKGGRGKRASYKTSVVRVPNPVMPQVLELINQFHEESKFTTTKTCPYKKISALSVTPVLQHVSQLNPLVMIQNTLLNAI